MHIEPFATNTDLFLLFGGNENDRESAPSAETYGRECLLGFAGIPVY